ncbi:MAG: DUF1080 domain-containing protein, partial [Halioglobus sp.]|nr:DUF1080 domain-containing protein [Halioglobus sp.]
VGGGASFSAEGEAIVGRHGPGANSFLRTDAEYGDFSLKLQMRWDEPGNSGVMFRAGQRNGDGRTYGYQYELDPSERAYTGGIYDEARRGWLAPLVDNPAARAAVRLDGWNDVEIEARGASLKTWINGVPAAEIIDGLDARGFIALQVHSGDSGVIRWRHIRIKALPGMAAPGESLLQQAEWRGERADELAFSASGLALPHATGESWLTSRRLFSDAMLDFRLPVCAEPTLVQLRYQPHANGQQPSFAEVAVYADRAQARLVTPEGEQIFPAVALAAPGERQRFVGLARGDSLVLSVGEADALRIDHAGLPERGQLRIRPGRCGERFQLEDVQWFSLKEHSGEPLFYQTLDTAPAPVLSPAEALQAFRVAPGFQVELVAAEPLVGEPVAMAWDEYGRLYVVEMRGYMRDAYGTDSEQPVGQVVRLTDTDGDGVMDVSEVFLGELVNPRAVAVVNEGILIGEPPNLWLCELPSRDALCTARRAVGGYATDVGEANVEHMENGLRAGLDNWLYNAKSARQLRLAEGELVEREGLYRGQWGLSKDDYGRWFYNHNSTWAQADFFQAEDLLLPGETSYPEGLGVNLTPLPEVHSVRVNPGVNRAYLEGTLREDGRLRNATGVSGLVVYRGDQFPAQYAGDVFVPESAGNVVAQLRLAADGLTLSAQKQLYDDAQWGQRDFLASTDERFRPVDAMNGPDGALYIIDMYRGIIQDDHFLTDELREQIFQRELDSPLGMGRIWRVRYGDGAPPPAAVTLGDATVGELLAALSHANGWVRDTAQRLLLARSGDLAPALATLATGDATVPALHAIWTLAGRAELERDLVMSLATAEDAQRQVHALRAGAALLSAEDYLALAAELADADPAVRMQLAFAMGAHAADPHVRGALIELAATAPNSVYMRQAVVRAVRGFEPAFLSELLASSALSAGESEAASAMLAALAVNAYRSLRGDLRSTEPANPALLELLALAESRSGAQAWQQIAMLSGFAALAMAQDFSPAPLAGAQSIFADSSVSEADPLWPARLAARRAFTWPGDELAMGIKPLSPEQLALVAKGRAFYPQCAACHGEEGKGIAGLAPALASSSWVTGPPEWLGRIILQGLNGPVEVHGDVFNGVMPGHGHLSALDDATLAGLMTYLRRSWGNKADPVSEEQAAAIRQASAGRTDSWTVAELQQVPVDRGFDRFEGKYTISFLTITVAEEDGELRVSAPMYGGGALQQLNATTFRVQAAGEDIKFEFVPEESGAVNTVLMHRKGEKLTMRRKQ